MLELNKLYNMDCMDGMREFPDGYFDIAIVDPPYGVGSITYMPHKRTKAIGGFLDEYNIVVATLDVGQRSNVKSKYVPDIVHSQCGKKTIRTFGDENVAPGPEYFKELFRVSKNQIIWGGNYFILPPSRCFIIWDKGIYASGNRTAEKTERIHPTQKPVELYSWLLQRYAKPGDKILDTHVGSASSLIACHRHGLDFVGFEIDREYFEAASERIKSEVAQILMPVQTLISGA